MRTTTRYSIVDSFFFFAPRPEPAGIDRAQAPGMLWERGEFDLAETTGDFVARVLREAAEAGFSNVEVTGFLNTGRPGSNPTFEQLVGRGER